MTNQVGNEADALRASVEARIGALLERVNGARRSKARARVFWSTTHTCCGVVTIIAPLAIGGLAAAFPPVAVVVAGFTVGHTIAGLGFLSAACGALAGFGKTSERIQRTDEAAVELENITSDL